MFMSRKGPKNLVDILQHLAQKLDANDDDDDGSTLSVHVRRAFLLTDALREGRKGKLEPFKNLKVCELHGPVCIQYCNRDPSFF